MIGAGVGGITTAARLAQQGYDVTVLEKNDGPGGRCGRIDLGGYRFDTGATLFLMPEIFAETFRSLGEQMEDYLELTRVDPTYHIHFGDGTSLSLTSDLDTMREQLEAIEPGSFREFLDYLEECARHYRLAIPRFMKREYRSLPEFLSPSNLIAFARLDALAKHHDNVAKYFKDERLRTAFTFQDLYLGLSPYAAPAIFSLIQYMEFADGIWFPRGGMYSVVNALVSIAKKAGVQFVYNATVARIDVKDSSATGVSLEDGTRIPADIVVANADLTYVYQRLLPQDGTAERLDHKKYGTSAVTFLWGLDKQYSQLGVHNLFLAPKIRESYAPLFNGGGLPDDPHFYVYAPARLDPSMAPSGGDAIMIAIPSGHIDQTHPQDWDAIRTCARESVLRRLARFGLDDLLDHIEIETTRTPLDWEDLYNLTKGSTHGLSHELTQMSYFRPHNQHARYRNLYFVGASTHPGTGIPNVLMSASFATRRILDDKSVQPSDADLVDSLRMEGSTTRPAAPMEARV